MPRKIIILNPSTRKKMEFLLGGTSWNLCWNTSIVPAFSNIWRRIIFALSRLDALQESRGRLLLDWPLPLLHGTACASWQVHSMKETTSFGLRNHSAFWSTRSRPCTYLPTIFATQWGWQASVAFSYQSFDHRHNVLTLVAKCKLWRDACLWGILSNVAQIVGPKSPT